MSRSVFKSLLLSNGFAGLMLGKFAVLIAWDWTRGSEYFAQYALVNGLVAGIFVLSGLQARMFVIAHIRTHSDFVNLRRILVCLGIAGASAALVLNSGFAMMTLLTLIMGQRVLENLCLAQASFEQVNQQRGRAYKRLGLSGTIIFGIYSIAPIWSLELALSLELLCLTGLCLWQNRELPRTAARATYRAIDILNIGIGFSLSAGMNVGLNSLLLYFCYQNFGQAPALLIAQILAAQAIIARLMASNSLYFLKALSAWIDQNGLGLIAVWAAIGSGLLGALSLSPPILGLVVFFTLLNIMNIVLRQNFIAQFGPGRLIALHALELCCLVVAGIWARDSYSLFSIFVLIRAARIPILIWLRQHERQLATT